jgi:hypothetical protein
LRAAVAEQAMQRAEHLSLHSFGAENETGNRNRDDDQRAQREDRVIGERRP